MTDNEHDQDEYDDDYVSKSQLKREMHELQAMGKKIAELPDGKRRKIPMPDILAEGIAEYLRLNKREAKRRQLQYIGKVMRKIDVEPIHQALDVLDTQSAAFRQHFHQLEKWRDQVVAQDKGVIEQLLEEFPDADRQQLRNLQRQAAKETSQKKPPAASRKIFAYLRELSES